MNDPASLTARELFDRIGAVDVLNGWSTLVLDGKPAHAFTCLAVVLRFQFERFSCSCHQVNEHKKKHKFHKFQKHKLRTQISDADGGGTITKEEIRDWLDVSGLSDADDIVNLFMVCAC